MLKKTGGHYPAPLAALEAVRVGLEHGITAGLAEEHHAFGELAVSDVSRKLVQIFFADHRAQEGRRHPARQRRSRGRSAGSGSSARGSWAPASPGTAVLNVEVDTRLKDADLARVGKGLEAPRRASCDDRLERRRITRPQYDRLSALLSGSDSTTRGFGRADLVIEAVFEDLEVKRKVLARGRGGDPAGRDLRHQHLHHPDPPDRRRMPAARSGCSACTSSRRWTRCRCSR